MTDQFRVRAGSGEHFTHELLAEGLNPTAVFAANNAIALGVIRAVGQRGLRIPHDLALVCFDDFDTVSHLLPFLTVAVQPAYDMGMNAAQMLLGRIEAGQALAPRHVVLSTSLIIRHSCGSHLHDAPGDGAGLRGCSELSLPLTGVAPARVVLVKPSQDTEPSEVYGR